MYIIILQLQNKIAQNNVDSPLQTTQLFMHMMYSEIQVQIKKGCDHYQWSLYTRSLMYLFICEVNLKG